MEYFNWIKAFHVIAMVTWFAGLFYLPRLYVYHAMSDDGISHERFEIMERKLYRGIMTPGIVMTWILGLLMVWLGWDGYKTQYWLHAKLTLVVMLTVYHLVCGHYRKRLIGNAHIKSHVFWRWFNELPTFLLIGIVMLVIVKPF